jgi:DNA-binding GntR family transcriptional regulator
VASRFTELPLGHDRRHGDLSAVNDGVLEPSQRLHRVWLTDELGVGSDPIRETVCRLVAEGPAVGDPNCGIVATHSTLRITRPDQHRNK